MRQAITDISHLAIGGSNKDNFHLKGNTNRTSISDLFYSDMGNSSRGTTNPESCVIRCTDILQHIKTCPVCSKLYKAVNENHQENGDCHDGNCHRRKNKISNSNMYKDRNMNIILIGMFLIIILLLIKNLYKKQD
jgi:hypothetical protein